MSSLEFGRCPVCTEVLRKENVYALVRCGHMYHNACITNWISGTSNCLICQSSAELDDIKKLNVWDGSKNMKLTVLTLTGKRVLLDRIKSLDKIEVIKAMIELREGIPPDEQRLIYAGKELENGHTIVHYGIEDQSTLHLVKRLKGC
ncbi:Ubiquitin-like domain-containing protein [Meloidogyne graminicola]|uniref:Ubiquitin-like domain-containing protein n=1 Tax=Meloidogyne graminicola TaxID=189291 RepID=A0A8S9ZF50_9BILA|nr:Ubiquitin-like domain-containing protein [Meloidogyne graminicola]